MKRLFCFAAVLVFLLLFSPVFCEKPQYAAVAAHDFHLRQKPKSSGHGTGIAKDEILQVLEYRPDWCRVQRNSDIGWCMTDWLCLFRSLDPEKHPLPWRIPIIGYAEITRDIEIKAEGFPGTAADKGDILFVTEATDDGLVIPVWRGTMTLPKDCAIFHALTPAAKAQPGDLISGFTTYYHAGYGGKLSAQRKANIMNGCSKLTGTVLQPGESFSFNASCGDGGKYSSKFGYVMGPSITSNGTSLGGGVCQLTTTLYNALLQLPILINEVAPHRATGVRYIPVNLDSAVGAFSDLKFTNTLPYPIRIDAGVSHGIVTVMIFRTEKEQ